MKRTHTAPAWLFVSLLAACAGTETDNPVGDGSGDPGGPLEPPSYESPIDLFPSAPAVPPCPPPDFDGKPQGRPLWGYADGFLVGADQRGVLAWVDVSDPTSPTLHAEVSFTGRALELLVEPAGTVTLVLHELDDVVTREVPDPGALEGTTRLVRYELSGSGEPQRVAEVEVEGEHWRLDKRGELYWETSARRDDPLACDLEPYACNYPVYEGLVVRAHRFAAGAFEEVQTLELPASAYLSPLEDGLASFEPDASGAWKGVLRYARFLDDGRLGPLSDAELELAPAAAPMSLSGDLLRLFAMDPLDGSTELRLYDLSGAAPALVGRVDAPLAYAEAVRFTTTAVYLPASNGGTATRIDHADPALPVREALPGSSALAWPLGVEAPDGGGELVLGLAPDLAAGALTLSLWREGQGGIETLDTVSVAGVRLQDAGSLARDLYVDSGRVWLPSDAGLRAVRFDAGALELEDPALSHAQGEIVVAGALGFAVERYALAHVDLASGTQGTLEWPGYEDVRVYLDAGGYEAALVRQRDGSTGLRLTRGADTTALPVSPVADDLLDAGDHLLVVSTLPRSQCEQSGFDCGDYDPGVDVVSLSGTPHLVSHVAFPDADVGDDEPQYPATLRLADGRYVFATELDVSCWSETECAALGIEPGPLEGQNVAPTGAQCAPPPPGASSPPVPCEPVPAPTVFGRRHLQRFQVLDAAADPPRFGAPVTSTLELDHSRFADPRVSGQTLLATRLESAGGGAASAPSVASFMLDRFEVDDAGELHALPPLNVPGYPVALSDDGATLITLEPASDDSDDVVAHALELIDDGAFERDEQRLDAVLDDFVALGDQVYVVRHTGTGCGTVTTLQPVALDGLALGTALELPGPRYSIADVTPERILLQAVDGFVVVDLGDPAAPALEAFVRPMPWLFAPRLVGDSLAGASYGGGRRRVEL